MRIRILSTVALASLALATQGHATTIFTDNFNSENGGVGTLNYNGFANWTVTGGTVDLIGQGTAWDFFPGNGLYVDLDGSTGAAGTMATSSAISVAPGQYVLSFMLGGSQRPGYDNGNSVTVEVATGLTSAQYNISTFDPLVTFTLPFAVSSAQTINLVFQNSGGDNVGAILDNVQLKRVPDGGLTVVLLGVGVMALGFVRRMAK